MAQAFDGRALGQMLVDTERFVEQTRDHEVRLSRVVQQLEAPDPPPTSDLLVEIRHLCADTREQRVQMEALLARLFGVPADDPEPDAGRPRVLIADDSTDQRDRSARALEASGFAALTAANGLEALMLAHYARPEVVVMGVSMPILDGIEAARLLKASPGTRHVRVIAHTAWPSFYDGPLKSVFDAVLLKPATAEALIAAVRRFLAPELVPPPPLG